MSQEEKQLVAPEPIATFPIGVDGERLVEMTPMDRIEQNKELIATLSPEIKRSHLCQVNSNNYMKVSGGISIANALGYTVSVGDAIYDESLQCHKAEATLHDCNSGSEVARAWGYVGDDEKRWQKGPKYALLSMTQTRAEAKLCRANFGHIYVMVGADSDTPAEEMQGLSNASGRKLPMKKEPRGIYNSEVMKLADKLASNPACPAELDATGVLLLGEERTSKTDNESMLEFIQTSISKIEGEG